MTFSKSGGMTLIELLVVITIMMVTLGIVGGISIASVDRAQAQVELISVKNFIKKASVRAFSSGAGMRIYFNEDKISSSVGSADLVEKRFEYLWFPNQVLTFNRNGYPDLVLLNVTVRSQQKEIELKELLNTPPNS